MILFSVTGVLLLNQAGQAASRLINGGLRRWPVRKQSGVYDVSSLPDPASLHLATRAAQTFTRTLLY